MHVHLDRDFATLAWNVYLFERAPNGNRALVFEGPDQFKWVDVSVGDQMPVSLRLPPDVLEALLAEAESVIPASHATERHLNDVIRVRDRLLTMVERADLIQVEPTPT